MMMMMCALSECPAGLYGAFCREVCNCARGATCHPVTGLCICKAGYTGDRCDQRMYTRCLS